MNVFCWQEKHYAHPDVELNIPRTSELVSYCTAPWEPDKNRPYAGMVIFLHGCGGLANDAYTENLKAYLAEKYQMLVVSVGYHASELHEVPITCDYAVAKEFFLGVIPYFRADVATALCHAVVEVSGHSEWIKFQNGKLIDFLDNVDQLNEIQHTTHKPYLKLFAKNGDYQNFGVLQALDILTVIFDLSHRQAFDTDNIIGFGSSHGGYLAHLCSKFAPNTFVAVIEANAYPFTPLIFIANRPYPWLSPFFIYELMIQEAQGSRSVLFDAYLDTPWEMADSTSPFSFGLPAMQIRNLNYEMHLQEVARHSHRRCQYRMIHSSQDQLFQPLEDRRNMAHRLIAQGMDAQYKEMTEADIDGRLVKHMNHGMGTSLRALFDLYYPTIKPTPGQLDNELGTVIDFQCGDRIYRFDHSRLPILHIL
jgi:hypothetical protein